MRILLFSQALTPWYGGSAFSEASLAGALSRRGHAVTIFCRKKYVDPQFVERFGKVATLAYSSIDWVYAWIVRRHPLREQIRQGDVVHLNGHWRWEVFFIAAICTQENRPYVLQPRGMLWFGHRRVPLKRVFQMLLGQSIVRNAHKVIALSTFETEKWSPFAIRGNRRVILPNGVVGGERLSHSETATVSAKKPPSSSAGYILYLGRLESRKNLVFLIQSFCQYRRQGGRAELWLVGPVERGYDTVLRNLVSKLNLVSHVHFLPPVFSNEKLEWMKNTRALVYPAIEEPFGRVPFEGLDVGAFPVIPRQSGAAEYISPFLPDAVYEDGVVESLTERLLTLEKPNPERDARRRCATQWVQKELHWDRVVQKYEGLYRQVTGYKS